MTTGVRHGVPARFEGFLEIAPLGKEFSLCLDTDGATLVLRCANLPACVGPRSFSSNVRHALAGRLFLLMPSVRVCCWRDYSFRLLYCSLLSLVLECDDLPIVRTTAAI